MNPQPQPSIQDLTEIEKHGTSLWPLLDGKRLFISGGTGFFGRWLLETLHYLIKIGRLKIEVWVLSRNPQIFFSKAPQFQNHDDIRFVCGTTAQFSFPKISFDFVIHAAGEPFTHYQPNQKNEVETILAGTKRMLDFAVQCNASSFLLTSSGAVYGRQSPRINCIAETHPTDSLPVSAYAEEKRLSEALCAQYQRTHGLACKLARCFAFIGPYLPLNAHYAAGNFLRNALHREAIQVQGDGSPLRSYLYPTDLMIWLLTILLQGESMRPYHVGAEQALSIAELAGRISRLISPPLPVMLMQPRKEGIPPECYVPSTEQTRRELNLRETVTLDDALQRTWHFLSSI